MRKELAARFSRIGLLLAAFTLVAAIIAQPLWHRLRPASTTMSQGGSRPAP
jgi:hypothetical protein